MSGSSFKLLAPAVGCLLVVCAASAQAQPGPKATAAPSAPLEIARSADVAFIKKAALGAIGEVELGRLAAERASDADVRRFGQKMVDEHGKANNELKQLASSEGIELPATLDEAHRAEIDRLSKLSGTDFDHAYVRAMVQDHDEDVAEFQKQLKSAHDVELQAWVSKMLPTLTEHQEMIHMIARDLPPPPKKSS